MRERKKGTLRPAGIGDVKDRLERSGYMVTHWTGEGPFHLLALNRQGEVLFVQVAFEQSTRLGERMKLARWCKESLADIFQAVVCEVWSHIHREHRVFPVAGYNEYRKAL